MHGQEASVSRIPDQFLATAIERLNDTVKNRNSSDLNAHAYLAMRAGDRFEIVYGTEKWTEIRPFVADALVRAENASPDPAIKEKIRFYHSSLFGPK